VSKRLRLRDRAIADIVDAATYIALDNPDAAEWFGDARLHNVRMWPVPKFRRYLVFYRELADVVEIVRVVHGARDLPSLFSDDAP